MSVPNLIKGRYEIREVLGQGGMGVVYSAYDRTVKRGVALKTIRDIPSRTALDLFYKECDVLASMTHPNIIEIFDIGEFDEDGTNKPYFVMPLLPGQPLEHLIRGESNRLTVERAIEILSQTCRGLQAAHERGLVHRDLKPSNIFVMADDSVKIIDFGVAHMADSRTTIGHKGTLLYMAPEQVEMKPASALSDIFSLGVVSFEMLTLRHPFERGAASDVASAILKHIPPPISELNPAVNATISRVIHKAIAKQPWYRFASAREMGEALQKAARNEPIEIFDAARFQPRVERAGKAFDQGDYEFADEILTELESEGHVDTVVTTLRRKIDQARRQKTIGQLLESARTRADEEEYPLALQKLQEVLELEPSNGPALALKNTIESKRSDRKIEDWFRLARQHMEQKAFAHARQALDNVLKLKPGETRALQLVAEVDRQEQEFKRIRQEKDDLYAKAMQAWQSGEVSAALSKLERLVSIDQRSPDTAASERSAAFQNFYNQVRSEHDAIKSAYEQARMHLVEGNFDAALATCNDQMARHPDQALFQALKLDIEERRRQEFSAQIAEIDRQVEAEPDLEKRVNILTAALDRHPDETHFERMLRTTREKRDLVNSIVNKARAHEERGQFGDALAQWEILKTIYGQYPGLDFEIDRIRRRRDQQLRSEAKVRWVEQVDWQLASGDFARAQSLLRDASAEFPGDPELAELEKLAANGLARTAEAQQLLTKGQDLCRGQRFEQGINVLRRAYELDAKSVLIRAALTSALVDQARAKLDEDWDTAEELARQALDLDPTNAQAKSLRTLAADRKREAFVDSCLAQARRFQAEGQIDAALEKVEQGLSDYPREARLSQLRSTLTKARSSAEEAMPTRSMAVEASTISLGTVPEKATVAIPPPAAQPVKPAPPKPAPAPKAAPRRPAPALIAAALASMLAVGGAIVIIPKLKRKPAPAPVVEAPKTVALPPSAVPPPPVNTAIRVVADIESGKVLLDDTPAGELQDGQISLENVSPGKHSLQIVGPRERAMVTLETAAGAAPNVESLTAKELIAVTVASASDRAKVQSSAGSVRVVLDGKAAGETGANGVELDGIKEGNHDLTVGEGQDLRSMVLGIGAVPMLTVFLKSDRNEGSLVLVTGEDGARVFLDGKEYRRKTQKGQLRIPNIAVKEHTVRVAKDGFQDTPEQKIAIRKGEEARLEFKLAPVPKMASLSITGAAPGAQVLLDGNPMGEVQDDGRFTASSVPPGDHTVELRKQLYRPKRIEKHFEAGGTVELAPAEAAMEKVPAVLKLKVTPADAHVTISRAGEAAKAAGDSVAVAEGTYTITAQAAGYAERSVTISVGAGETKPVELALSKLAAKNLGMNDWEDPAGWVQENSWYVRKGGNFVAYKPGQTEGTFVFTADLRKGKRLQWVAARIDAKNYVLFQIDRKNFYRIRVIDGKETVLEKIAYPASKQSAWTIQMDVSADSIVNKLYNGSQWVVLDAWAAPGRQFGNGKFGFLIPGGETVAISNFGFTPK